jgi:enoyl-[acyl-carrier protein] reductase I
VSDDSFRFAPGEWALILGGSSGIGLACARELARHGMSLILVHRDLRGAASRIERDFDELRAGAPALRAINGNALEEEGRSRVLTAAGEALAGGGRIKLLLHSIAQGNLKPMVAPSPQTPVLEPGDFSATVDAMGLSLFTWVREIYRAGWFAADARVLSLTSEGSTRSLPHYAAVSAAKAALEAVSRAIAVEFAPFGVRCNVIQAGVCDTPALRKIPGAEALRQASLARNPFRRLTAPEDIARFVYLMARPEAAWVNGAILRVDGGDSIA